MLSFPGSIPIRIHPLFWLLAGMIGWINSQDILGTLIWIVIITISILVHEFGHALSARYFGQTAEIELIMLGGVTQRTGPKLKLWQEFVVVFNGPLAGLMLGMLSLLFYSSVDSAKHPLLAGILFISYLVNIIWTIFNLLPVHPLDGGKLLNIFLESILGFRGIKIGFFISIGLSLAGAVYFFINQSLFAGSLFLIFAFENYRAWQAARGMSPYDHDTDLQKKLESAEDVMKNGNYEEALTLLNDVQNTAKTGYIYLIALQNQASILAHQQRFQESYEKLIPIVNQLTSEGQQLFQTVCYRLKKWEEAIHAGNRAYQNQPNGETALINSFCHACLGQVKPAIGWLQCAFTAGVPNPKVVLQSHEFDQIRQDPSFQAFSNNILSS